MHSSETGAASPPDHGAERNHAAELNHGTALNRGAAPNHGAAADLARLLTGRRVVVLTGAGCSTESGIPDYRGPEGRFRAREPMRYAEFVGSAEARRRYWVRSAVGWTRFAAARPNPAHAALARLEDSGAVTGIITQNVDGLHHAAGSRGVVELHGALSRVRCLDCGGTIDRASLQERILETNPDIAPTGDRDDVTLAPDGDADVPESAVEGFRVPECDGCGGVLKPDVVFFGETVPTATVEAAWRLYEESELLLVVGSSLAVFSGRRFVYRAEREGVPIAVVNLGRTRADEMARLKVERKVGEFLPRVADLLLSGEPRAGSTEAGGWQRARGTWSGEESGDSSGARPSTP